MDIPVSEIGMNGTNKDMEGDVFLWEGNIYIRNTRLTEYCISKESFELSRRLFFVELCFILVYYLYRVEKIKIIVDKSYRGIGLDG